MSPSHGSGSRWPRRRFLGVTAALVAGAGSSLLAACAQQVPATPAPAPSPVVVTQVVTQVVEKQVTQVVTQQVTQVVTQQVVVTATPPPAPTPTPAPSEATRKAGGTINIWQPNGWPEQAWHLQSNWESGWATSPMAQPLFFVRPDGTLEPLLGMSVTPSEDGLMWTLKLRPGVKWSDGQPVTAADYEYGVLARLSPDNKPLNELRAGFSIVGIKDYINGKAQNIAGIKVVDDMTVQVTISAKDATMRNLWFGDQLNKPLPKHAIGAIPFKDLGKDKYWITNPVSAGPYVFKQYVTDQYIEYAANPSYWDNKPRADKLFMRISTPDVALVSLQKGDLDLVNPLDPTAIPGLKGLANVEVVEGKDASQWYGLERNFFTKNGMWRNPKAVQGLWYAIDRQAYVNSILQGYGVVRNSFYDGTPYACPSLTKYDYNMDMAKQLWAEVGMPKDQPIVFMSWTGIKPRLDFLPIAQAAVQKLGYKSEVDIIDNSLIDDYINGKGPRGKNWDFHVLLYGLGVDPGTPEAFVDPKSTSNWAYRTWPEEPDSSGKKHPTWVYDNPQMSKLFVQGRQESDPAKRTAIYQQIDCMWNQDLPCLMIASPSHMIARSTRLQGVDWQTNAGIGEWTVMFKPGDFWVTS